MIDPDTLEPALDEIRSLVQADGGDMLLTSVVDTTVNLELVVEGSTCVECGFERGGIDHADSWLRDSAGDSNVSSCRRFRGRVRDRNAPASARMS